MSDKRVEFWFDFGSPYSYLAYKALPALARSTGAVVDWRPMLLGGVFKATGNHSPAEIPAKSRWMRDDLRHRAAQLGAPFRHNPHFPINTLTLMRGAIGFQMQGDDDFQRYLHAIFAAMWADPRNLADPAELDAVLAAAGFDPRRFEAKVGSAQVKDALKRNTEEAVARGVFGAPSFFVGDRLFWGQDRLDAVAVALAESR